MDPAVQRATCAAVLDVLARTRCTDDAARECHEHIWQRALNMWPFDRFTHHPTTPPSAVDAVLSWCARELDRVGVP